MAREIWGKGLFVKNDKNGHPIHVGDTVKVTRHATTFIQAANFPYQLESKTVELKEEIYTGKVILRRSTGVSVRIEANYIITPKLTNRSNVKWTWELVDEKPVISNPNQLMLFE